MLILTMTGILLVLLVIAAIAQDKADFRKHQQMVARFGALPGFTPTQYLVGCDAATGVAIDETRRKLGFLVRCGEQFFEQILLYDDVLAVEIFQDGVSVTRTGQTSQVDGAGIDPVTRRSRTADKVERCETLVC
jgi:hypothetical protein